MALAIPHIALDLREERICLALSARGQNYLQQMRTEAITIVEGDNIYVPQIQYACPFFNALNNIHGLLRHLPLKTKQMGLYVPVSSTWDHGPVFGWLLQPHKFSHKVI